MSSILKALKKLEEEKSLQKNEMEVNISRDILRPQVERKSSVPLLLVLGISSSAVIIMLSLALFHKSTSGNGGKPPLPQAMTQPPASLSPPPSTAFSRPPAADAKASIAPPSPLKTPNKDTSRPTVTPASKAPLTPTELPKTPVVTVDLPKTDPAPKIAAPIRTPLPNDTTLTLSGIAWNKDSTDRLAIINGQPTATGAIVNNAVVEEILQDRVRMNLSGKTFELFLGGHSKTN